jgi:hypothetical protein
LSDAVVPSLRNDKEFALAFARNKMNMSAVAGFDCSSSSSDDENGGNGEDTAAGETTEVPTSTSAAASATPVTTTQGLFPSHPILKAFSKHLRANKTIPTAFLAHNGGNLAFLSYPLPRDFKIVQAAISQDPLVTVYCIKSPTQRELSTKKEFMGDVFILWRRN